MATLAKKSGQVTDRRIELTSRRCCRGHKRISLGPTTDRAHWASWRSVHRQTASGAGFTSPAENRRQRVVIRPPAERIKTGSFSTIFCSFGPKSDKKSRFGAVWFKTVQHEKEQRTPGPHRQHRRGLVEQPDGDRQKKETANTRQLTFAVKPLTARSCEHRNDRNA